MSSLENPSAHKRKKPSNDIDRISSLPKSVLCHILSFLPTEDAVTTCLVSRSWRFLWTNIHNLIFDDYDHRFEDRKIKFTHFVSKVLIFLNQQPIEKFSLEIENYCELYDVTTWIATALSRKVKVLQFRIHDFLRSVPHNQLPSSIFTCHTLEVLVLFGIMRVNVPSLICLPNLKSLTLVLVSYESDESVRNLITGCSALETLYIERDICDNVVTYSISSTTLRKLLFTFIDSCLPEEYYPKVVSKLEINAPALRCLQLQDELSGDFSVENLCSLDEAVVLLRDEKSVYCDRYAKAVLKLLQGVSNAKHLRLSVPNLEALSVVDLFPSFPRLVQLEAEYCDWSLLLKFVKVMNTLESLTFEQRRISASCWRKPEKVPICFLSCLQKISITRFEGLEDEFALMAYILQNSKVLRSMKIETDSGLGLEARHQLLQKVSKFSRGSEECEITF